VLCFFMFSVGLGLLLIQEVNFFILHWISQLSFHGKSQSMSSVFCGLQKLPIFLHSVSKRVSLILIEYRSVIYLKKRIKGGILSISRKVVMCCLKCNNIKNYVVDSSIVFFLLFLMLFLWFLKRFLFFNFQSQVKLERQYLENI